jgi:hypothetical protein
MSLKSGKHTVSEIDGQRCTIVETGINEGRMNFLKELLVFNKLEVKVMQEKPITETTTATATTTTTATATATPTYTIGVTSFLFNPVIAVYDCSLRTKDGKIVTPAYWNQKPPIVDSRYWIIRKKADNQE